MCDNRSGKMDLHSPPIFIAVSYNSSFPQPRGGWNDKCKDDGGMVERKGKGTHILEAKKKDNVFV